MIYLLCHVKSVVLAVAGLVYLSGDGETGKALVRVCYQAVEDPVRSVEHGSASWYSIRTNSGTETASGKRLCDKAATAAHKTLPMGTKVRVTNETNGKSEVVTITDRGPYVGGRIIDLTIGCAERLDFVSRGEVPVKVEVLGHFGAR
jgi:rare lipoprotein A